MIDHDADSPARRIDAVLDRSSTGGLSPEDYVAVATLWEDDEAAFQTRMIERRPPAAGRQPPEEGGGPEPHRPEERRPEERALRPGGRRARRLAGALAATRFADPALERARAADLARLVPRDDSGGDRARAAERRAAAAVAAVEAEVAADRRALLDRLGAPVATGSDEALFRGLVRRVPDPERRARLWAAWRALARRRLPAWGAAVDGLLAAQDARCAAAGHAGVRGAVLGAAATRPASVEALLDRHLSLAADDLAQLLALAPEEEPGVPRLVTLDERVRRVAAGTLAPVLPLDSCLEYAAEVMRAVLGLAVDRVAGPEGRWELRVSGRDAAGEPVRGTFLLDPWRDGAEFTPNRTLAIRNATRWGAVRRPAVSHVSCSFEPRAEAPGAITFGNAHSLLHELGHALNHLLMAGGLPALTGLEALPVERRECLPLWFEKWLYHPAFEERVTPVGVGPEFVARARTAQALAIRRSRLHAAVVARVDWAVRGAGAGGVAAVYRRLDERHGLAELCPLETVLPHFTRPVALALPGADFSYVWGAADACAVFGAPGGELAPTSPPARWTDPLAPDQPPDCAPLFAFYRRFSAGWEE